VRHRSACTALIALFLVAAPQAWAQSDGRALYDRIDRLERDMAVIQGQSGRGLVVRSPAIGGGVAASAVDAPTPTPSYSVTQRLDERVDQLEEMMRQLTGKLEEANFKADRVARQLERMQADIDLRFKEIQTSGGATAPAAGGAALSMPAAAPATAAAGAPVLTPPRGAVTPEAAGTPHVLGQLSDKDLRKAQATPPPAPAAPAAPKDPQAAYDEAYALTQKGDYDGAERAFQSFLKDNPNHQLAGNALFWLGDIAYSQRKDFAQAAQLFADGYKRFPKHTKAPEMLARLGQSFAQLDKKVEACKVYSLLTETHPDMPDRIKRTVAADRQRLACK